MPTAVQLALVRAPNALMVASPQLTLFSFPSREPSFCLKTTLNSNDLPVIMQT